MTTHHTLQNPHLYKSTSTMSAPGFTMIVATSPPFSSEFKTIVRCMKQLRTYDPNDFFVRELALWFPQSPDGDIIAPMSQWTFVECVCGVVRSIDAIAAPPLEAAGREKWLDFVRNRYPTQIDFIKRELASTGNRQPATLTPPHAKSATVSPEIAEIMRVVTELHSRDPNAFVDRQFKLWTQHYPAGLNVVYAAGAEWPIGCIINLVQNLDNVKFMDVAGKDEWLAFASSRYYGTRFNMIKQVLGITILNLEQPVHEKVPDLVAEVQAALLRLVTWEQYYSSTAEGHSMRMNRLKAFIGFLDGWTTVNVNDVVLNDSEITMHQLKSTPFKLSDDVSVRLDKLSGLTGCVFFKRLLYDWTAFVKYSTDYNE